MTPKFMKLLIPRKTAKAPPDPVTYQNYAVDMHAIEVWAAQLPAAFSGGTTFYASLTGPGETVSPGNLTQAGGFAVVAGGQNITLGTNATATVDADVFNVNVTSSANVSSTAGTFNVATGGGAIINGGAGGAVLEDGAGAGVNIDGAGNATVTTSNPGGIVTISTTGGGGSGIILHSGAVTVGQNAAELGFRGATPSVAPTITGSRGGNVALANLLTAGNTMGLWIDSTTP